MLTSSLNQRRLMSSIGSCDGSEERKRDPLEECLRPFRRPFADCELTGATAVCMYTQSLADTKAGSMGDSASMLSERSLFTFFDDGVCYNDTTETYRGNPCLHVLCVDS